MVTVVNGKATIQEFQDNLDCWENDTNRSKVVEEYEDYGLMWRQVMGLPKQAALQQYGLEGWY